MTEIDQHARNELIRLGWTPPDQTAQLRAALQKFVDRVERGEIRSRQTYAEFKALLEATA